MSISTKYSYYEIQSLFVSSLKVSSLQRKMSNVIAETTGLTPDLLMGVLLFLEQPNLSTYPKLVEVTKKYYPSLDGPVDINALFRNVVCLTKCENKKMFRAEKLQGCPYKIITADLPELKKFLAFRSADVLIKTGLIPPADIAKLEELKNIREEIENAGRQDVHPVQIDIPIENESLQPPQQIVAVSIQQKAQDREENFQIASILQELVNSIEKYEEEEAKRKAEEEEIRRKVEEEAGRKKAAEEVGRKKEAEEAARKKAAEAVKAAAQAQNRTANQNGDKIKFLSPTAIKKKAIFSQDVKRNPVAEMSPIIPAKKLKIQEMTSNVGTAEDTWPPFVNPSTQRNFESVPSYLAASTVNSHIAHAPYEFEGSKKAIEKPVKPEVIYQDSIEAVFMPCELPEHTIIIVDQNNSINQDAMIVRLPVGVRVRDTINAPSTGSILEYTNNDFSDLMADINYPQHH